MKHSLVKVAPSVEPVSLTEAKAQLRIDASDTTYDTEITNQLKAARQWIEQRYGISLITQTRIQRQDQLYERYPIYRNFLGPYYSRTPLQLLYPPVQSVTSFKYIDPNGTQQTLDPTTGYTVTGLMTPYVGAQDIQTPRMYPNTTWPAFKWIPDAIEIEYVCGYGPDATYVPETIKVAIKMVLSHFFENRMEEITGDRVSKFEMSVDRIMASYENFQMVGVYA
jgi:uncharacterized phiE125 gp8 family phage protein